MKFLKTLKIAGREFRFFLCESVLDEVQKIFHTFRSFLSVKSVQKVTVDCSVRKNC